MDKAKEIHINTQLKNVPLFSNLSDRQLDMIYTAGIIRKFTKGHVIVHQNDDPGDTFYIVVSGHVKVALLSLDGKEMVLAVLKECDFFGELSLLDNEPRSASVIVTEDATLFLLTQMQFHRLITAHPDILRKVLNEICGRLRHADEKIESLAFLDVYGRTISVLQQLARDHGIKTKNGVEILNAPTHQDLSSLVGSSRETITRIIKLLKESRNLVSYKGRKIILREYCSKPVI